MLEYTWLVDNEELQTGTSNQLQLSLETTGLGSAVTCRIRAYDSFLDFSESEFSVDIINAPPIIESMTLTPEEAYSQDAL